MNRFFLFLIFSSFLFGCKRNKKEIQFAQNRPVLRILEAGKPVLSKLHAANIIGKKYGLRYEMAGDCTESEEFLDSLEKHNKQVFVQLTQEFGAEWYKFFEEKVDSMEFLVSQAESFIQRQTEYKEKRKELEANGVIMGLWIEPTENQDIFNVEAYEVSLFSSDSNRNVYHNWTIDLADRKVVKSVCNNCR